jgi:hypothetical protein|tara:strand:- start:18785 stop:19159 length:375 start_codon:yes stop_codon:yes gene_type:complete
MIKNIGIIFFFVLIVCACKTDKQSKSFSFETGSFKTYLKDKKDSSTFYRTKNLQIETYKNNIDTFTIKWKNKFEFSLKKTNPKSKLDSTSFVVKIKKIKNNSYEFEAGYVNNNFKQTGTTIKLK